MNENYLSKIISGISLILLMIIASYINNILVRLVVVFILSIILDLTIEIINYIIYKKADFILCLKEIKTEKDKKQKQANILILFFLPIFQTITVIILSVFIKFKF